MLYSYLTSILTGILFRLHTFFSTNLVLIQLNFNKISLWLNDPFREITTYPHSRHHHHRWNSNEIEHALDHFFNDTTQQLQIRDFAGQLIKDDADIFKYRIDVRGFKENEIRVDLEEEDEIIVIKAEHKEESEKESIQRSFCRKVSIPKNVQKELIKCELDENGRLVIFAPKKNALGESKKRSIPIEFKKSNDLTDDDGTNK